MAILEPLRFDPIFKTKVWGGRALEPFVPGGLPVEGPVGEVWVLVDRPGESSQVASGTFVGRSLRGLMLSERAALLGRSAPSVDDAFPLLVKYLDARRPLSVQVHPDAATALRAGGGAQPKDEGWYFLAVDPEGELFVGLRDGVEPTAFAAAASGSDVVELLNRVEVRPGDYVSVPAGTVHSIGAGTTLVEVQQNADTTYRLYDWDRRDLDGRLRTCHLEQGLLAIEYDALAPTATTPAFATEDGNRVVVVQRAGSFEVDLARWSAPETFTTGDEAWAWVVLEGGGRLVLADGRSFELERGQTWLCPADLPEAVLHPSPGGVRVLRARALADED